MNWQDISTAPKDGTPILAFREPSSFGTSSPLVFVAWNIEADKWVWPDEIYDPYVRDSYTEAYEDGANFEDDSFTHWVPIPDQPSALSEERAGE